ncbi:MAG: DUF1223 domain-containing protein, partial [Polyangiaceae bacterium]
AGPAPAAATGAPVVYELFTNNDCPSCDSAESELNRLASTQPVAGARVVPLAFHVDFYGGTTKNDPFVLAAATQRQQTYDAARGRVYTPQAIVDGDREFTGWEDGTARSAIAAAAKHPKAGVAVFRSARVLAPPWLPVSIRYGSAAMVARGVTLTALLTESGIVVNLPQSERGGGHTLMAPVVRSIQEVGGASLGGGAAEATLAVPVGAVRSNLVVVVLLQDAGSHHVLGVGTMGPGGF